MLYVIRRFLFTMRDGVEHPTSFVEASQKKAKLDRAEQEYKREADCKEAGELRSGERAGILSDLPLAGWRCELKANKPDS